MVMRSFQAGSFPIIIFASGGKFPGEKWGKFPGGKGGGGQFFERQFLRGNFLDTSSQPTCNHRF